MVANLRILKNDTPPFGGFTILIYEFSIKVSAFGLFQHIKYSLAKKGL
jgi:hypothetical protein